jgi:hydrogenase/urease accessory protein HupE
MLAVAALAVVASQSFAEESTGGAAGAKAPLVAKKHVPTIIAVGLGSATALAVGLSGNSNHGNSTATSSTPSTR